MTKKKVRAINTPEGNPKFWEAVEQRRAQGKLNENLVLEIVKSTKQPLSSKEIAVEFSRRRNDGIERDIAYINKLLASLVESGSVYARTETMDERKIRANGHQPRGHVATLYTTFANSQARRTKYEALTGITLKSEGYTGKQLGTYKYKKPYKSKRAQARQTETMQTGSVSRVEELEARVRELEAKLLAIRTLSS